MKKCHGREVSEEKEAPVFVGVDKAAPGRKDFSAVRLSSTEAQALRDSVAAHQAECGCHVAADDWSCCSRVDVRSTDPVDSAGNLWHLDPLCKVRPEARS